MVGEAEDGTTALGLVDELAPEVVLLDIQLPDISGFDVAERLLASSGAEIVLVSTRDRTDYGPLIEGSGARGFVSKTPLRCRARQPLG